MFLVFSTFILNFLNESDQAVVGETRVCVWVLTPSWPPQKKQLLFEGDTIISLFSQVHSSGQLIFHLLLNGQIDGWMDESTVQHSAASSPLQS